MSASRRIAIFAVTARGATSARRLYARLPNSTVYVPAAFARNLDNVEEGGVVPFDDGARAAIGRLLGVVGGAPTVDGLVLCLATGAAVRLIAPHLRDKSTDPAVVCVDETCRYAVSLLAGHRGGANALAHTVATVLGAEPIITTASDRLGLPAVDLIGHAFGWRMEAVDGGTAPLTDVAAAVVNGVIVGVYQDAGEAPWWDGPVPPTMTRHDSLESLCASDPTAALVVTDRTLNSWRGRLPTSTVVYRPRVLVLGMGCRRGVPADEILGHARATLHSAGLSERCVRTLASADLKADEPGLQECATSLGVPFITYPVAALRDLVGDDPSAMNPSATVERLAGTPCVSEPAALLAAGPDATLVVPKTKASRVTCAIARIGPGERHAPGHDQPTDNGATGGSLVVIGLGPGDLTLLPARAREALAEADVVVGYRGYLDLIVPLTVGKMIVGAELGEEVARATRAIDLAQAGAHVALVSSGDAGVYGMAGLVYEVLGARGWTPDDLPVTVVPGISAVQAAASLLGAPLMHDVATISLSDLLTPRDVILRRLEGAAAADFVLALYNPASRRRTSLIVEARAILLRSRPAATPVGLVSDAYRLGQHVAVTTVGAMLDHRIDMRTIVIVGNSSTRVIGTRMVTPRGYAGRYDLSGHAAERATIDG